MHGGGFRGTQRLNGVGHGADVRGRCAAAAAENAHTERGRFAGKEREIFRRRLGIDDAVAFALRKAGVRHAADAKAVDFGQLAQDFEQWLRAEGAVRADDLHVFCFELRGGTRGAEIAVRCSLFRVSKLSNYGQAGKGANGIDSKKNLLDVGKSLENVEIDAALFECESLLVEHVLDLVGSGVTRLHAEAKRPNRAGDQNFAGSRLASFASDFYAARIEALHFVSKAKRSELEAVRAKRVGLYDLRARFDVRLVNAENGFRFRGIQLIEAALCANSLVQHRTHRAICDENRIFQPFIKVENFHGAIRSLSELTEYNFSRGRNRQGVSGPIEEARNHRAQKRVKPEAGSGKRRPYREKKEDERPDKNAHKEQDAVNREHLEGRPWRSGRMRGAKEEETDQKHDEKRGERAQNRPQARPNQSDLRRRGRDRGFKSFES